MSSHTLPRLRPQIIFDLGSSGNVVDPATSNRHRLCFGLRIDGSTSECTIGCGCSSEPCHVTDQRAWGAPLSDRPRTPLRHFDATRHFCPFC
jgi:hypothetical protein